MTKSPLDQFKIASLFNFVIFNLDFSFNTIIVISLVTIGAIQFFVFIIKDKKTNSFSVIPSGWQHLVERLLSLLSNLLMDILRTGSDKYFPFVSALFIFILFSNLIGLVPYSFTITSHITITFLMSFSIFIATIIIGVKKHGIKLFGLFLPANTTFFLALLLVPIELISFIAKPISLGVRLFINLMAGHSLLKVIVGFAWKILLTERFKAIVFVLPLLILVLLIGLELGVALIQAYVFITLTSIYLVDCEELH